VRPARELRLQVVGKLSRPAAVCAATAGQLVTISCQLSQRRFLVDTGASFSLLPHRSAARPSGPRLTGPNGIAIAAWGEEEVELVFSGRRFKWRFLLAAVSFPILGIDFLQEFNLLVDVAGRRLVSASTGEKLLLAARSSGPTAAVLLPADAGRVLAPSPPSASPPGTSLRLQRRPGGAWAGPLQHPLPLHRRPACLRAQSAWTSYWQNFRR